MKIVIKKILNEISLKQDLNDNIKEYGWRDTADMVGGDDLLVDILYDGNLKEYFKATGFFVYRLTDNQMTMYIDDVLIRSLNIKDFGKKEKLLGDFTYGPKNGIRYRFNARVYGPYTRSDGQQNFWKVVGMSGDSGFGYAFISLRNTLGKRARVQIFQQIIDKYNLDSYKT